MKKNVKLQFPRGIVVGGEFKRSLGRHIYGDEGVMRIIGVLNCREG